MIVYDNLWVTMKKNGITQYRLIHEFGFSHGQLDRLRKNENVNMYTLDVLCRILNCEIQDIATYKPDEKIPEEKHDQIKTNTET